MNGVIPITSTFRKKLCFIFIYPQTRINYHNHLCSCSVVFVILIPPPSLTLSC
jgi:hypothetical protein